MKQFLLVGLLALGANFGLNTTALAETMVSGCGTDVMFAYDLPRDDNDTIVFARSFDLAQGEMIDETKTMDVSEVICLPEGSGNVHRLRLGHGVSIDLKSDAAVTELVRWLEDEALAEIRRTEEAYGIETANN
jgi:hypothetical protein